MLDERQIGWFLVLLGLSNAEGAVVSATCASFLHSVYGLRHRSVSGVFAVLLDLSKDAIMTFDLLPDGGRVAT